MKAPSRLLEAVVALAIEAGGKILDIYHSDFRVGRKTDGEPLTAAELVSLHFLTERLQQLNGGFPVLAAGGLEIPFDERYRWETYWLVDPLDGAQEFAQHSGEFAVNIALIHRHQPVLGVVYAPAEKACYFAAEGCGAFKKSADEDPRNIQVRMRAPARILVVGGRFGELASLEDYLSRIGDHDFNFLGSSLKFCKIAEGEADLFPHIGKSYEWTTAAAQCIVEEAGGEVTDLRGKTLTYNAKPSLENPFFLAFGDKAQDWFKPAEGIVGSPESAPLPPSPLLAAATKLALVAGLKIMEIYQSDFRVAEKNDQSPLTAADLVSHHCLVEGLSALEGGFPVLSEESATLNFEERQSWETYWLIDPLDGTKEFVKRNGEFTVNIALIRRHRPVLGVVFAPALGLCYLAEEGRGAFRMLGDEAPREIRVRAPAPEVPAVLGSRSHRTPELETYLERLGKHELKSIGSSLKLCQVAEGEADVYPRLGPTCEWDTAAAQCIVEVAGGAVTDLRGAPLLYNTKASLLNPYFLVFGDKSRNWTAYAEGLKKNADAEDD